MTPARKAWEAVVRFLSFKREHYCLTFAKDNPHAQAVLRDLAKFCRANATAFDTDARIHAALEGRREVWLRIQQHLNLQPDELAELFGQPEPKD